MRLTGENTLNSTRWHTTVWKYFIYTCLYFRLCLGFAAIITNPSNVTTCLGSSATFTCEVNETEPIRWLVDNVIVMANDLNGFKIYTPNNQSSILSIPIINLFQQSVQCYISSPFAYSLKAFLSVQAPPSAPTNVTSTILNRTSVVLAWEQVYNAQPTSLSYVVLVTNGSGAVVHNVTVTKPPVTIPTPDPCDHYEATVTATYTSVVNCSGNGTTIQLVEAPPSAPTNLTTTRLNATSVKLAWAYSPQFPALSYIVLVTNSSGASVFSRTVMEPPVNIPTPDPCDHYKATVTATYTSAVNCSENGTTINIVGGPCEPNATSSTSSQLSSDLLGTDIFPQANGDIVGIAIVVGAFFISTLVVISIIYWRKSIPLPPTELKATDVTTNSMAISWQPPQNENACIIYIIGYEVRYTPGPDGSESKDIYVANQTTAELSDLKPHTKYSIRVKAKTERSFGDYSDPLTVTTEQEMELEFVPQNPRCGCGHCAYVDIIYHRCNVQRDGLTFPFIDTKNMTDSEKNSLINRLKGESMEMLDKFDRFCITINTWLKENITLKDYKEILLNISGFEQLKDGAFSLLDSRKDEINAAIDYEKLHNIVKDYINWFSYSLLKVIVDRACEFHKINPGDTDLKGTYETDLHSFCKRCIYECPIPTRDLKKHSKYLCVKVQMPQEFIKIKANEIQAFLGGLSLALGLNSYTLKLCHVADGCVEVLLSVPTSIHTALFPLSSDARLKLTPLGVMKICTDGYYYERDTMGEQSELVSIDTITKNIEVSVKSPHLKTTIPHDSPVTMTPNLRTPTSSPYILQNAVATTCVKATSSPQQLSSSGDLHVLTPFLQNKSIGIVKVVEVLLSKGAKVDQQDENGQTLLMTASINGDVEGVEMLLSAGADVNLQGKNGQSSLMLASMKGHVEIVKMLLSKGAKVDLQDEMSQPPHPHIFQRSSLMFASMNGHVHIVEMLLSAGAKVDLQGLSKQTALMYASQMGHVKVVEMLLTKGANVDLKDEQYGNSSLILASMHGHVEVMEMLISKGAQVDLQNKDGKSSLMWASMNDHVEVVEVLLSKGAQVDLLNKNKQSSLMMASETGQVKVVKKLLEAGADINLQEGTNEWTSLMLASMKGHKEVVGVLLSKHANVNVQDKNGLSSLMMASSNGHKEVVKMLLLDGADVNLQGKFGQTAFTMASMKGHFEVVEILSKGAQVDVQNKI